MSSSGIHVLSNASLPAVAGYSIHTFGDYLAPGHDSGWQAAKERRDLAEILPLIPTHEKPDVLICSSPEYLPLPPDLAAFSGVKILLITDWNVCLRFLPDLCRLFDFCFTDWPGFQLLRKAGVNNIHHQPLFGHDPEGYTFQGKPRTLDVSFCGNLNAGLHRERNRLLARVAKWGVGRKLHLGQAFNQDYLDVLNRSRLVFNYSVRGEANMRIYEAMACGAVPLVEASNQEVGILFEEGTHFFRYRPDNLESTLDTLLADTGRIEAVAHSARAAVAGHTKAEQLRSLLQFTGQEGTQQGHLGGLEAKPNGREILEANKALVKLRVLGAGYRLPEAIAELQQRASALLDLEKETLPGCLLSLLESNPLDKLDTAENYLIKMVDAGGRMEPFAGLLRMRIHALRGRWDESLQCSLQALQVLSEMDPNAPFPRDWYGHFHSPVDLGKGSNTDLNLAYRNDLSSGSRQGYLHLMHALCLFGKATALFALGRLADAVRCAEGIPKEGFVSIEPYALLAQGYQGLGEDAKALTVLRAWLAEKPLDTVVWDKVIEALRRAGDRPALIAFLEEIYRLGGFFLSSPLVEVLRGVLERERGTP